MDALQTILRPIMGMLNRNIQATTPARKLCAELAETVVAVRVRDTALAAYFIVLDESLDLVAETEREPKVVITGSLTGDAETARQFQRLLAFAKPDIEEELSGIVGDVAAHRLGEMARGIGHWGRAARATMGANIREYLQEESRDVPSRYEVDRFAASVSALRDDVDRLEARLSLLRGGD